MLTWTQIGQDINGEKNDDQSGWSVSLSADGTRMAIGAPNNAGGEGLTADKLESIANLWEAGFK